MFNLYNHKGTQNLYRKLTAEVVGLFGVPCKYMPATSLSPDFLYGEDIAITYDSAINLKLFLESFDFFEGKHQVYDMKGLTFDDRMTFSTEISMFQKKTKMLRPGSGDIICFSMAGAQKIYDPTSLGYTFYKIEGVEEKKTYFQFGELTLFEFYCSRLQFVHEEVSTGDPELDALNQLSDKVPNGELGDNVNIADVNDESSPFYDKRKDSYVKKHEKTSSWDPNDPFSDN